MVNRERTTHGLQPLRLDTRLASAAREHTYVMRRKIERSGQSGFQHQGSCGDRIRRVGYEWQACGENIAYGKNQSVAELHAALLESPEHRANLLSEKFRDIGIGIEQTADEIWITQDFAAPLASGPAH